MAVYLGLVLVVVGTVVVILVLLLAVVVKSAFPPLPTDTLGKPD